MMRKAHWRLRTRREASNTAWDLLELSASQKMLHDAQAAEVDPNMLRRTWKLVPNVRESHLC